MKRDEFKAIAEQAVEQLVSRAEEKTGLTLSRSFCFSWIADEKRLEDDIAEFLVDMTFVDEDHICPCFDLFLEDILPDGRLLLNGYRAAYDPCSYGAHFNYETMGHDAGRVGPFKLGMGNFVEKHGK